MNKNQSFSLMGLSNYMTIHVAVTSEKDNFLNLLCNYNIK